MEKEIKELNAPAIGLIADILDKHMDAILSEVRIRFKQIKADQSSEPAEPVTIPQTVASDNPEPVAWAMFADNGNIRIWGADPIQVETLKQQYGNQLKPLYDAPQPAVPDVLPGEAIFGFAAWLTSLKTPVTFSECHGAAIGADLAAAYNSSQGFVQMREDFHKRLKPYPKDEPSQPVVSVNMPSDAEIIDLWYEKCLSLDSDKQLVTFARALLARYGQPATDSAGYTLGPISDGGMDPRNADNRQARGEPVLFQSRTRPIWVGASKNWTAWENCTKDQANDYKRVKVLHDWEYEVRELYTAPQPPQIPEGYRPNVPEPLKYGDRWKDHYVTGWNNCRAAMLEAAPEVKP